MTVNALLCKVGNLPFTYLGLPIGGSIPRVALWDPIIKKIESRLATWKGRMLSIAGRVTLIKASISSLPLYYMSIFPAPKGVIEAIIKIQRRFLWSGDRGRNSLALVAWDQLVLPKIFGGLNVGSILNKNISLLFKWVWRLLHDSDALWQKVIRSKYGYSSSFTAQDLVIPAGSGPWRFICSSIIKHPIACDFLKSKIRKVVGNGRNSLFWMDTWVGVVPLKKYFPRLFSIAANPHASVASCGSWIQGRWEWNLEWIRNLRPRDLLEWSNLQSLLEKVCISRVSEDSLIWTPHKLGIFSVKSCSTELAKPSLHLHSKVAIWKRLWRGLIPPRVEVFSWLALLEKLGQGKGSLPLTLFLQMNPIASFALSLLNPLIIYYCIALSQEIFGCGG